MNQKQLVPGVLLGLGGFVFGLTLASPITISVAVSQETPPPVVAPPALIDESGPSTTDVPDVADAVEAVDLADAVSEALETADIEVSTPPEADAESTEAQDETDEQETEAQDLADQIAELDMPVDAEIGSTEEMEQELEEADSNDGPASDDPVELSVRPGSAPILPSDRPAWVDAQPDFSGEIHRLYVSSPAVTDEEQVELALEVAIVTAFDEYIKNHLADSSKQDRFALNEVTCESLGLTADDIFSKCVVDPEGYMMELDTTPPMFKKYVALEINKDQRAELLEKRREAMQRSRLAPLAVGLIAILGLAGMSHMVFKRKNVLPASETLEAAGLVANQVVAAGRPKPKKAGSFLGFVAFMILIGGMIFLVLMPILFLGASRQSSVRREITTEFKEALGEVRSAQREAYEEVQAARTEAMHEIRSAHSEAVFETQKALSEIAPMPPTPPQVHTSATSDGNSVEYRFESGGQTIIIRDK